MPVTLPVAGEFDMVAAPSSFRCPGNVGAHRLRPASTALTMLWYPVQRQMLPSSPSRTVFSSRRPWVCARSTALMTMPGVQ